MLTFKLAEYLPPFPTATWTLARQAGVTHAVSQVPPDDLDGPGWEFLPLRMKTRFADAGLTLWLPRCLEPAGGIWATTHDVIHYGRIHVDSRTTTGMANV